MALNCIDFFLRSKELPIIDKIAAESCKNGFIFSTPKPKPQISSVKEALTMADDEVRFT